MIQKREIVNGMTNGPRSFAPNLGLMLFDALSKAEPLISTAAHQKFDLDPQLLTYNFHLFKITV